MTSEPGLHPSRLPVAIGAAVAVLLIGGVLVWWGWEEQGQMRDQLVQWIAAVATAAAVVIASVAAVYAFYAHRLEQAREATRLTNLRQAQASVVAAWWSTDLQEVKVIASGVTASWGASTAQGVAFRNASPVPVSEVVITGYIGTDLVGVISVLTGPPNDEPTFHPWPRETMDHFNQRKEIDDPELRYAQVGLRFIDSQGVRWYRHPRGQLRELALEDVETPVQPTEGELTRLFNERYEAMSPRADGTQP